jgi:hypothetical protein
VDIAEHSMKISDLFPGILGQALYYDVKTLVMRWFILFIAC